MKWVRNLLWRWLGVEDLAGLMANRAVEQINEKWEPDYQKLRDRFDSIDELKQRIEDLESAYPDYKKAKAEADEKKAGDIVPGFTPFTQRKRRWEAEHRKPQKKTS